MIYKTNFRDIMIQQDQPDQNSFKLFTKHYSREAVSFRDLKHPGKKPINQKQTESRESILLKDKFGKIIDERKIINNYVYPFSAIGCLTFTINKKNYQGTGCLIGQNIVLTCAHNCYNHSQGKEAEDMVFELGPKGNRQKYYITKMYYNPDFSKFSNQEAVWLDYAVLQLSRKIGDQFGYLGVQFLKEETELDNYPSISIAGYPGEVYFNGPTNANQQLYQAKTSKQNIQFRENFIGHKIPTTSGQSGSPIYVEGDDGEYFVIGVHIQGQNNKVFTGSNLGKILSVNVRRSINEWIGKATGKLNLNNLSIKEQEIEKFLRTLIPSELTDLNLCNNLLEKFPASWEFSNLQVLQLAGNQITVIPPQIANLKEIIILNMQNNKIEEIPKEMENLTKLKILKISRNSIKKFCPFLPSLEQMEANGISIFQSKSRSSWVECFQKIKFIFKQNINNTSKSVKRIEDNIQQCIYLKKKRLEDLKAGQLKIHQVEERVGTQFSNILNSSAQSTGPLLPLFSSIFSLVLFLYENLLIEKSDTDKQVLDLWRASIEKQTLMMKTAFDPSKEFFFNLVSESDLLDIDNHYDFISVFDQQYKGQQEKSMIMKVQQTPKNIREDKRIDGVIQLIEKFVLNQGFQDLKSFIQQVNNFEQLLISGIGPETGSMYQSIKNFQQMAYSGGSSISQKVKLITKSLMLTDPNLLQSKQLEDSDGIELKDFLFEELDSNAKNLYNHLNSFDQIKQNTICLYPYLKQQIQKLDEIISQNLLISKKNIYQAIKSFKNSQGIIQPYSKLMETLSFDSRILADQIKAISSYCYPETKQSVLRFVSVQFSPAYTIIKNSAKDISQILKKHIKFTETVTNIIKQVKDESRLLKIRGLLNSFTQITQDWQTTIEKLLHNLNSVQQLLQTIRNIEESQENITEISSIIEKNLPNFTQVYAHLEKLLNCQFQQKSKQLTHQLDWLLESEIPNYQGLIQLILIKRQIAQLQRKQQKQRMSTFVNSNLHHISSILKNLQKCEINIFSSQVSQALRKVAFKFNELEKRTQKIKKILQKIQENDGSQEEIGVSNIRRLLKVTQDIRRGQQRYLERIETIIEQLHSIKQESLITNKDFITKISQIEELNLQIWVPFYEAAESLVNEVRVKVQVNTQKILKQSQANFKNDYVIRQGVLKTEQTQYKKFSLQIFSQVTEKNFLNLKRITLSRNMLKKLPANLTKLEKLEELDVSDNWLEQMGISMAEFRKLKVFNAEQNEIKAIPEGLSKVVTLQVVNLSFNKVDKLALTFVKDLQNLVHLNLKHNFLTRVPATIKNLFQRKNWYLNLSQNNSLDEKDKKSMKEKLQSKSDKLQKGQLIL